MCLYKKDTVLEVFNRSELEKRYVIYRNVLHDDSHPMTCDYFYSNFQEKSFSAFSNQSYYFLSTGKMYLPCLPASKTDYSQLSNKPSCIWSPRDKHCCLARQQP